MPQKTDRILFITVCAWCGSEKSMRYLPRPGGYEKDAMISHGICDRCKNQIIAKIRNIPVRLEFGA
jgi:hypothetical protein